MTREDQPTPYLYGEKPFGFGFPLSLTSEAQSFLGYLCDRNLPRRWPNENVKQLVLDCSKLSRLGVESDFDNAYKDNIELEERQTRQLSYAVNTLGGGKVGELQIHISPLQATVTIKNVEQQEERESRAKSILESLPDGRRKLTQAARAVQQELENWLTVNTGGELFDRGVKKGLEGVSRDTLLADDNQFEDLIRQLDPEVGRGIKTWFEKRATPAQKAVARSVLVMLAKGETLSVVKRFLENPLEPPKDLIRFFPFSILEVGIQEEAFKVGVQIEEGKISDAFAKILGGGEIKIERFHENRYSPSSDSFRLPRKLQQYVTQTKDGSFVFDLTAVGQKKLGLVLGSLGQTLELLNNLTGLRLSLKLERDETGQTTTSPRTSAGLEPYTRYLKEKKGSLDFYPPSIRHQIDVWRNRGWTMATFVGPTGAGKTTLARTLALEGIKKQAYEAQTDKQASSHGPYDDAAVYRFKFEGETSQQLLAAQQQFSDILAQRPGKVTMLVIENFHTMSFTDIDSATQQQLLNLADEIKGLFKTKNRRGGLIQIGESLPENIDGSYINDHRYQVAFFEPRGEERFDLGTRVLAEKVSKLVKDTCHQVSRTTEERTRISSDLRKQVEQGLSNIFQVFLIKEEPFMQFLLSDKGEFFTTTKWNTLGDQVVKLVEGQIQPLLLSRKSEWFVLKEDELRLTEVGQKEFPEQLRCSLEEVMRTADLVARTKEPSRKAETREPPEEFRLPKPAPAKEKPAPRPEGDMLAELKTAESAIATARREYEEQLKEQEGVLATLKEKYGEHLDLITSEKGLFQALANRGYLPGKRGEETRAVLVTLSEELTRGSEPILQALNRFGKLTPEQSEQAKSFLEIVRALTDLKESDLGAINRTVDILETQMQSIRDSLGKEFFDQVRETRESINEAQKPIPAPDLSDIIESLRAFSG